MQYNAMDDAMKMRIIRRKVNEQMNAMEPSKLLIVILDLVNPTLTKPLLRALRDSLSGKTDIQLDRLIAELHD